MSNLRIIYTIGTSTRSLGEFITLLKKYNIKNVVDIRRFPTSRRFPHFKKENLEKTLSENGFSYFYLGGELGGYRREGYIEHMKSSDFIKGIHRLIELSEKANAVFFCSERFPWKCHRRFVADALIKRGWKVIHIIDASRCFEGKPLTFSDDTHDIER